MYKAKKIVRQHLLDVLDDERFVVLQAPGGYGKTFLARQLIEVLKSEAYVYFIPLPWERAFYPFALRLVGELRRVLGNEHFDITNALLKDEKSPADFITHRCVRELTDVRDEISIVIEDTDFLDDDARSFIFNLMLYAPDNVRILICSRKKISETLPASLRNELTVFDEDDLAFTEEEVAELFSGELTTDRVREIIGFTEGWPLGVSVVWRAWEKGGTLESLLQRERPEFRFIFDKGVFEPLDAELRDFLMKTSLLPYFDYDLVRVLFDDGARLLDEAIAGNLYVEETEGGGFRYHRLFGRFLEEKAAETYSPAEVEESRGSAGLSLLEKERYEEGFRFLVHSQSWEILEQAVKDNFELLEAIGSHNLRGVLSKNLPTEVCKKYPYLGYFGVEYVTDSGKYELAVEIIQSLMVNRRSDDNIRVRVNFYLLSITLRVFSNIEAAGQIISSTKKTLIRLRKTNSEKRAGVIINKAWLLLTLARYESHEGSPLKEVNLLIEALKLIEGLDNHLYTYLLLNILPAKHNKSGEDIARLRALSEKTSSNPNTAIYIGMLLVDCYIQTGELEKAEAHFGYMTDLENNVSMRYRITKYYASRYLSLTKGDIEGCIDTTEDGIRVGILSRNSNEVDRWKLELALFYLILGDFKTAGDQFVKHFTLEIDEHPSRINREKTITYMLILAFNDDLARLEHYLVNIRKNNAWFENINESHIPLWHLIQFLYSHLTGSHEGTELNYERLKETSKTMYDLSPYLLERALAHFPGLADAIDQDVVKKSFLSRRSVRVELFGAFKISSYSGSLDRSGFRYGKSAELVAILAMSPNEPISAEHLIFELWGEVPPIKGRSRLKNAVYWAKKALQLIGLDDVIQRLKGTIGLNPDLSYDVDALRFEQIIVETEALLPEGEKERAYRNVKEALALSEGGFLPHLYSNWSTRWFHYYALLTERALDWALTLSAEQGRKTDFIDYAYRVVESGEIDTDLIDKARKLAQSLGVDFDEYLPRRSE